MSSNVALIVIGSLAVVGGIVFAVSQSKEPPKEPPKEPKYQFPSERGSSESYTSANGSFSDPETVTIGGKSKRKRKSTKRR